MLTACGIETEKKKTKVKKVYIVATVLTACGIETLISPTLSHVYDRSLQQCLPLAVLKRVHRRTKYACFIRLQQCLPLAVLKHAREA